MYTNDERQEFISLELSRYYGSSSWDKQIQLGEALARNLVSIADHNALVYDTSSKSGLTGSKAIYILGSTVENSCSPTLSSSTTDLGLLEYAAEFPIPQGSRPYSYLGDEVFVRDRKSRRRDLQEHKRFLYTRSKRCLGVDECSPLWCGECGNGTVFHTESGAWSCTSCDWNSSSLQRASIVQQLDRQFSITSEIEALFNIREQLGDVSQGVLSDYMRLQYLVAENFHPLHWLHALVWESMSTFAKDLARGKG
jgi:ribosomal protein L37AE/L43A